MNVMRSVSLALGTLVVAPSVSAKGPDQAQQACLEELAALRGNVIAAAGPLCEAALKQAGENPAACADLTARAVANVVSRTEHSWKLAEDEVATQVAAENPSADPADPLADLDIFDSPAEVRATKRAAVAKGAWNDMVGEALRPAGELPLPNSLEECNQRKDDLGTLLAKVKGSLGEFVGLLREGMGNRKVQ